jgi:hypothetical protein
VTAGLVLRPVASGDASAAALAREFGDWATEHARVDHPIEVLDQTLSSGGRLYLESASFMHGAHALYRSAGFEPSEPYPGREFEEFENQISIFMRLDLS